MSLLLENQTIPEAGPLKLDIKISTDLKVSAKEAQHKVSMLLFDQVSYLMFGDAPQLVIGNRIVWRVPAYLSLPQLGKFGPFGTLDVDAENGEIQPLTPELIAEMTGNAQALTARHTQVK